jgi:hypothetical protein
MTSPRHRRAGPRRPSTIRDLDTVATALDEAAPLGWTLKGIRDALHAGAELYAQNQAAEITDEEMRTIEASRAATTPTLAWFRRAREAGSSTARDLAARTAQRATWVLCQWIAGVPDDGTWGSVSGFEHMRACWPEPIASGRVLDGRRDEVARLLKMATLTTDVETEILWALGFYAMMNPAGARRLDRGKMREHLEAIQSHTRALSDRLFNAATDEAKRATLLWLRNAADTTETPVDPARPALVWLSGGNELLRDAERVLAALDTAAARALADPLHAPPPKRRPTTRAGLRHCILSLARIYEAQRKRERADAKLSGDFLSLCCVLRLHELMPRERSGSERTQMDALRKQVTRALAGRDEDALRLRGALARPRSTLRRRR